MSLALASLLALVTVATSGFTVMHATPSKYATQPFEGTAPATGNNAPPVGTQPLAKGLWDSQNYRIPYHAASCPQPPQSAQARLALAHSAIALQNFGLPSPATFGGDMAKWTDVVSHMQTHHCDHTTPILQGSPIINNNITYDHTWSGFGSLCATQCTHYNAADMKIVDPGISVAAQNEVASHWVGVGGAYGDALSQDGIVDNTFAGINWDEAFYQTRSCSTQTNGSEQDAYETYYGESFYFYTNQYGTDYLDDYTTGNYQTEYWGCGATTSAEMIQERVTDSGGHLKQLGNFGTLTFHNAEWEDLTSNWHGLYDSTSGSGIYQWVLQNSAYQYMITFPAWPVSDTGYGSTWEGVFQRGT